MAGGGTIDLDWSSLTPDLAERLVGLLNSALSSATRPSFIGPVSVSSFDFGTAAPDIELVDVRDIYPDFLEDDQDEDPSLDADRSAEEREKLLEDFEWVPGREGAQGDVPDDELFDSRYLPPHIRHSQESVVSQGNAGALAALCPPSHSANIRAPEFAANFSSLPHESPCPFPRGSNLSNIHSSRVSRAGYSQHRHPRRASPLHREEHVSSDFPFSPALSRSSSPPLSPSPSASPSGYLPQTEHPDVQLHFHIDFESNLRLMINTSLQINYPSPMIMALPIKICVIGLVLEGELVVAYEGSRKRVHVCFLDELATHGGGPAPASPQQTYVNEELPAAREGRTPKRPPSISTGSRLTGTPSKPSPPGIRLLPSILLESEIGQEDKHVLRNVARVERFIQDVIRKTVEEELVYPNFHTIVLADSDHHDVS
jgi:distribution and morphology protein 12